MNKHEKNLLKKRVEKILKEDSDLFDFEAEVDMSLTYDENITIIEEKTKGFINSQIDDISRDEAHQYDSFKPKIPTARYGFKTVFKNSRIVGLAGSKSTGKTNNLVSMIVEYRLSNPDTPIYVFGIEQGVMRYLKSIGIKEISSLRHLHNKRDCIIIIDEFQMLELNTPKYRRVLNAFIDFIYHTNCYVIFSSPQIREFNTIIGSVIETWLLKSIKTDQCINGSQLKKVVSEYKGKYEALGCLTVPVDELLLVNGEEEITIPCEYISDADDKKSLKKLF